MEEEAESEAAGAPDWESTGSGIAQAHDRFFRYVLQAPAEQLALIGVLFPTLAPQLDVNSVSLLDGTFVDDDLTQRQTDVALSVRLAGEDVIIYVLIEHQRSVDPWMALRMMRYQGRIWDRYVRQHPRVAGVPAILPVVVYQGTRPWTAATDVRDLIVLGADTAAGLGRLMPRMCYRLDDLSGVDVESLLVSVMFLLISFDRSPVGSGLLRRRRS